MDDAAHAAASRNKEHLAEIKKVLCEDSVTAKGLDAAMKEELNPLSEKLLPTLAGLKLMLGPFSEHGAQLRSVRDLVLVADLCHKSIKTTEDSSWDINGCGTNGFGGKGSYGNPAAIPNSTLEE